MKIEVEDQKLVVSGLKELGYGNSLAVRDQVRPRITETSPKVLEINLAETMYVDSCGLGALISLDRTMKYHEGTTRLVNPTAPVVHVLELTRMHRFFEIVHT